MIFPPPAVSVAVTVDRGDRRWFFREVLPVLALSVRQPFAELIIRSAKTVEFRSIRTRIRCRVCIYASIGRLPREVEAELAAEHRLAVDELPRGVIVGTVEVVGCQPAVDGFAWQLRKPRRWKRVRKPSGRPGQVWFRAFVAAHASGRKN